MTAIATQSNAYPFTCDQSCVAEANDEPCWLCGPDACDNCSHRIPQLGCEDTCPLDNMGWERPL